MTDVEIYRQVKSKINYNKAAQLFKFKPHEKQQEIIDTIQEGNFSAITITCGRRFGKTLVISDIGATEMLIPNASVLLITPTFSNAQTMYTEIEKYVQSAGVKITSRNTKQLTFTTEVNSTIYVVTPKSISNALGKKFSLVIVDEGQDIEDLISLWENYIQPAQADYGVDENGYFVSKTIFIATARDKANDMYELIKRTYNPKYKGYVNFTYPTSSNPYIPKEYIESKRKELDPVTFGREYEGKWSDIGGERVYYTFDKERHVINPQDLPVFDNQSQYLVGIDIGFADNTAFLLAAVQPLTGHIYVLAEYAESGRTISQHVSEFKAIEEKLTVEKVIRFIDPSAAQVANDFAVDYDYYCVPGSNDIQEGIKSVNERFYKNELFISSECYQLIEEIEEMHWKENGKDVKRTKKHKHFDLALAALRYLVYSWKVQNNLDIVML